MNSTKPWYLTTLAATVFNPTPGVPGWNVKTIKAFDRPGMYFPVPRNPQHPADNHLDEIELDYRFHLSVIAATSDSRNDANDSHFKQATVEWKWLASQDLAPGPNYAWNPVNVSIIPPASWQAATGDPALVTNRWGNEVIREPAQWNAN